MNPPARALRAFVVDDEPLARELLVAMLADHPDVEVTGQYGDGASALAALSRQPPDVLFLDVRMPELSGFEVLAALPAGGGARLPAVVFVTAFDEYALRAFDVSAVDYLLKPFDEARLAQALARVRSHLGRGAEGDDEQRRRLGDLLARLESVAERVVEGDAAAAPGAEPGARSAGPGGGYLRRLVARSDERAVLVPVEQVRWLEAAGKWVRVHADTEFTLRDTMARLEAALDPERFVRVSRSAIVNLDRVREIQTWFHGDHQIVLDNGDRVKTTRGYREAVAALLAGS
ncbi:MAG TPA: LytTR family DNA-binding domain-containing protein [Thermoanaerobaculia bacterium]|nr:LytTR family DNA-binding domain-containing protein [Thermoanaerobaculia bacterium]